MGVTALVLWLAFGKLAQAYESGLQALNETVSAPARQRHHRRWLDRVVAVPPLSWWLRDPVSRAAFLLVAAYLIRDRDVKLRLYPSLASILVVPFVFLLQSQSSRGPMGSSFTVPFSGVYLGLVSMMALQILQFSQQWQAAEIFRAALPGPAALSHGARRATICMALPIILLMGLILWLVHGNSHELLLLLPGIITLPVFSLVPLIGGHGVPLSRPADAAKASGRGATMIVVMLVAFALAGAASLAWSQGWFGWFLLGEILLAGGVYAGLRGLLSQASWPEE